jgi:cysteine desulfuration protein SufE|tara:strand:- start:855 stop:1256 length:402 start_codon:yes stop_codon:yes gene_type:complete
MILNRIKEMGDNLKMLEGHDRLQYLVDKAKEVEPLPEAAKIEQNRIHGCASKLWIIGGADSNQNMQYQVDGDAFITKGTAKVVTDLVNGEHRSAVANLTVEDFTELGIKELLTMQRQNGLGELISRIIRIAHD